MNGSCLLAKSSWRSLGGKSCLPIQHSAVFWLLLMNPLWRRCEACSSKIWWHESHRIAHLVDCWIERASVGWSPMSMEPSRLHDNEHYHTHRNCLLLIVAWMRSVLPATRDANGEKSCERERPCCKPTPMSGWAPLERLAMGIIAVSSCARSRRSALMRSRCLCPFRKSLSDLMDCTATPLLLSIFSPLGSG